ncbi:MAG: DUF4178 domain-containing protein [Methanophagales archaeon]|nr:DUF4178 domain-containing protein [Methanophagales archaeon]MCW3141219.1 DUF4178 domain-containing protein [Methanophagales archaeon]
MGLLERSKRILEIKREKRKKQRGEGKVDTKSEELREGCIGTIDGLDFTVLGRLVYDWGGGRWEEFYLEFSDMEEHKWLSKEGTTLELLDEVESADAPDPDKLKEGAVFDFQGGRVKVNEVGKAWIVLVEGSFPWNIAVGTQVTYADCEFERTGEILSLEKPAGARIEVYRGNEISRRSLEIF